MVHVVVVVLIVAVDVVVVVLVVDVVAAVAPVPFTQNHVRGGLVSVCELSRTYPWL